ncbi:hypothetical protein D934_08865 [Xylella fastidiosa subsp. sandyi Ann-1]|uniref:Uncharacterized protein n=2 Tax=Xylella fastidiosa TaxID=2371 RepID=A0A060H7V0_XYLFS|nr:hypothetical protein D934_08865 [Xylella fastidiosa subsp. sandyi Ann-1]
MMAKHPLGQPPEFKTGVAFLRQVRATLGRFVVIVLPVAMV